MNGNLIGIPAWSVSLLKHNVDKKYSILLSTKPVDNLVDKVGNNPLERQRINGLCQNDYFLSISIKLLLINNIDLSAVFAYSKIR